MSNDTETTQDQDNPVIALLEEVRGLIGQGDCKPGAVARDAEGHPCDPNGDKATSYTLAGAITRAVYNRHGDSTGVDTVHVLLGVGNMTDASIAGLSALDSDELDKRFDRALATARGEAYEEPEDDDEEPSDEGEEDVESSESTEAEEPESDADKSAAAQAALLNTNRDLTVDQPSNPNGNKIEK